MPEVVLMAGPRTLGPFGAYGKMPTQGDFFRLDLPSAIVTSWDAWLQRSLPGARIGLGDRWQECYFSAPIWRFSVPAGIVGPRAVMGVLMPSVDRVGRAFPLTLLGPTVEQAATPQGHLATTPVFEALELIALDALEEAATRTGLHRALRGLNHDLDTGAVGLAAHPAEPSIVRGTGGACQWSALLGDRLLHLRTPSLPTAGTLAEMFDPSDPVWSAAFVA